MIHTQFLSLHLLQPVLFCKEQIQHTDDVKMIRLKSNRLMVIKNQIVYHCKKGEMFTFYTSDWVLCMRLYNCHRVHQYKVNVIVHLIARNCRNFVYYYNTKALSSKCIVTLKSTCIMIHKIQNLNLLHSNFISINAALLAEWSKDKNSLFNLFLLTSYSFGTDLFSLALLYQNTVSMRGNSQKV